MNLHVLIAEEAITQAMIDDTLPNDRLSAAIRGLDKGACSMALTDLRQVMAHCAGASTRDALTAILDDWRTRRQIQIADLQILAIGFYRLIWRLLARLDATIKIDDIRHLDAQHAAHLCYGFTFGLNLWPFPIPGTMISRIHQRLATFLHAADTDHEWKESGPIPMSAPLVATSDHHLSPSANAIRNIFFTQVFIDTLTTEHAPPLDDDAPVFDFLLATAADPARMSFLHHVTPAQARFRLTQLAQALIALHQVESSGSASESRCTLSVEGAIACLLSPFASLHGWLRANRELLLIPVTRELPGNDLFVIPLFDTIHPRWEALGVPALH